MRLLGHQPDPSPGLAVILLHIKTIYPHPATAWIDQTADDADQRGFACTIRSQQGKDFATADLQVNALQGRMAGSIGFGQAFNRNYRDHRPLSRTQPGEARL